VAKNAAMQVSATESEKEKLLPQGLAEFQVAQNISNLFVSAQNTIAPPRGVEPLFSD
jgi:hypothetical protein